MEWYDGTTNTLSPEAFSPHKKNDTTGISITRAAHKSIEDAAKGMGNSYYIAELRVGDLRDHGIEVVSQPIIADGVEDISHAELPGLNAANYKSDGVIEWTRLLAEKLTLRIEGPFSSQG